jgi:thiol-disulfide isomerase/thioredoxin
VSRFTLLILLAGCSPQPVGRPAPEPPPFTPQPIAGALDVGDTLPALQAAGWVHGPPPARDSAGVKLMLVDVWAQWCPHCREGAPGLLRLHKKYADRGVAFVGISNMSKEAIELFVESCSIPWANGYNMPAELLPLFGASTGERLEGYAIAPVVYLIGPDGKIKWHDKQARFRHKKVNIWEEELDAAIEAALAANP